MNINIPDYLFSFSWAASALILFSVTVLIWRGALRMNIQRREQLTTATVLTFALMAWFSAAFYLGKQNIYWAGDSLFPTIPFGILLPIVFGLIFLTRSKHVELLIDAIPFTWIVGIQFYRTLGVMFLILMWDDYLPMQFALPAGIGDIITGILALIVTYRLLRTGAGAYGMVYAWCLFGIADLIVAVTMGALTSPGLTHLIALDNPNMLATSYPLVMIPTFAVPLSIILHVLCLIKLRRIRALEAPIKLRHQRQPDF